MSFPYKIKYFDNVLLFNTFSESARKFIENLGPLFKRIADFHDDSSKANNSKSEKIRIVVLDSGIDRMDPKIRAAILDDRINSIQSKSFIGPSDDLQDTHGHGTHVTKLLLNTAQAAEIYIGKVFAEKTINDELMSGITEVRISPILASSSLQQFNITRHC